MTDTLGWWSSLPTWLPRLIYLVLVFLFPDSMFTTPGAQVMRGTAWQLSPKQEPTLESTALDFEVSFWFGSLAVPALVLYAMESVRDSLFSSLGSTILELACLSFWLLSAMVKSFTPHCLGHSLLFSDLSCCRVGTGSTRV